MSTIWFILAMAWGVIYLIESYSSKSDDAERERTFFTFLLLLVLGQTADAQDWRKLDYQGVSYVAMPRADLDTIYAMRIGKNVAARKCAALLNDRNDEIAGLQKALSASERSRKNSEGANDILREANTGLITRNDKLALKAKRRGKVVAVLLPICVASIGLHVLR